MVSIPDMAIAVINLPIPSSDIVALQSTQPLTEMSIRNLPVVKELPVRKANKQTTVTESSVQKMWTPRRLTALWASTACCFVYFTLFYFNLIYFVLL
jgi:hypothetical protein